jgi:hypothetical protein
MNPADRVLLNMERFLMFLSSASISSDKARNSFAKRDIEKEASSGYYEQTAVPG